MHSQLDSRSLYVLKLLLADQPVLLAAIAKEMNVSEKTAKKELDGIAAFLERYDAKIGFRKGTGYWVIFRDDAVRVWFINEVLTPLLGVETFLPGRALLRQLTLSILLLSDEYIALDTVAEKLFVSRSSVSQVSNAVRKSVRAYHLETHYRSHHGMKILGKESDFRYAICDQHEFIAANHELNDYLAALNSDYETFYQEHKAAIVNGIQASLRWRHMKLYPAILSKLSYLVAVLAVRFKKGCCVPYDDRLAFLRETPFYAIASDLLRMLGVEEEAEIFWFTRFLFANGDTETILRMPQYRTYLAQAKRMDALLLAHMEREYQMSLPPADGEMQAILARIVIKSQYRIKERFLSKEIFYLHKNSVFTYSLAVESARLLQREMGIELSHDVFFGLALYHKRKLDALSYPTRLQSILLLSPYHPAEVRHVCEKIGGSCSLWIKEIAVETSIPPTPSFDLIFRLTQSSLMVPQSASPVLILDGNPSMEDYLLIYRHIHLAAHGLRNMMAGMEMVSILSGVAKTKRDIFHLFCLFQKADMMRSVKLMEDLGEREELTSFENKAANTILFIAFGQDANRLHILKHRRPFLWKTRKVEYYVFLGIDGKASPFTLKFFRALTDTLILQPEMLHKVYQLLSESRQDEAKELLLCQGNYWF